VKLLRETHGIEPVVVTGPATDNAVGIDMIVRDLGVEAINALTDGVRLGDLVAGHVGLGGERR